MAHYELNLRDYIRIFHRRKLVIIVSFVIFSLFGGIYSLNQVPVYRVATSVKIEERKTIAGLLTEWIAYNPGDTMETQAKIIRGFPIMKKAAWRLGYVEMDATPSEMQRAAQRVSSSIETERVGNTNIIKIIATSVDPQEAINLANTVAEVYIEESLLDKNKQARTVREFVEEQLTSLKERLEEAEEQVKAFGDEVDNIKVAEPIQEKLIELEFQLAALKQKYTGKHPKIIQLREQIDDLKAQIKGFSGDELEYARMKREVEVNRKLYAMLKENLEQARITEAEKVSDVSILDPAVMPSAPMGTNAGFGLFLGALMGLVIGCILAFVGETLDTSIGKIEDVEEILKLPVLGIVPSLDYEFRRKESLFNRVKDQIFPRKLNKEEEDYFRLIAHHKPSSIIAESFRNIRTNLKVSPTKKTFLVTSAQPEEGKSILITNLGLVIAQEGARTLLVSSDLRRPILSHAFKIDTKPGLSEVLSGVAKLKDALRDITDFMVGGLPFEETVKPSGLRNISILPSGGTPPNPAELLGSREMPLLIRQLRQEFDVIFFDSPPILPVTDASLIAPLVDAVIICYEIGSTSREALLRTKVQLESVNANIQGVILNNTKPQVEPIGAYPYYVYKHRYYKKEPPEEESKEEAKSV